MDGTPIFGLRHGRVPSGRYDTLPPQRVLFGPGTASHIGDEVARLGVRRAFVVTGRTIATSTPLLDRVVGDLGEAYAGAFTEAEQHGPRASVLAAADAARAVGADAVVSLGGGTVSDAAKIVALCLAADVHSGDQLATFRLGAAEAVAPPAASIPHLALPTTLSGGEFTHWAGVTDESRGVKEPFGAPHLVPRVVFLDPELTRATPGWLWASTGMRAIDHAVEIVYSPEHQPFADALCLRAVEMLTAALPRSHVDPDDDDARGICQLAAWMAMTPFTNVAVGLSHAISHQLGAYCGIPHGVCSCILLPAVMDLNRPATAPRQALLATAMGVDTRQLGDEDAAAAAADRLRTLVTKLGIRSRLRDWDVGEERLPGLALEATKGFVKVTESPTQIEALLRSVY